MFVELNLKTVTDLRTDRWLLPDGVNELMPDDAWQVELMRRRIIDNCAQWGYEFVMPPLIEYLDSLLTGTGETLDLQTFKFVDQHNGRMLGIRADMTPQVARMDAHALSCDYPNRLFYTGSVLRTRTDGAGSSRTPIQFGAELFGHAGPESDIEIIRLMLDSVGLSRARIEDTLLDIGHVGVFRGLMNNAKLSSGTQELLFQALLRGSTPEVDQILESEESSPILCDQFRALSTLSGESEVVLKSARVLLAQGGSAVHEALDNLEAVVCGLKLTHPNLKIHVDLAELRGYRYHTGILFALYDAAGGELARGGRYDSIGESFGRARPATGFSGDLVNLALLGHQLNENVSSSGLGIWIDQPFTEELWSEVCRLRKSGERVVMGLGGSIMDAHSCKCDRALIRHCGEWIVQPLT